MSLSNKPLDSIEESDLQALVDNKVSEGKTIEYKESLPLNDYESKKDFLADVSSFANAAGGHLIYGIKEESGEPIELCGLQNNNADDEILRLENLIRDSIEPRIPGVSMRAVPLQTVGVAIIIRIPKSWALPHVVRFQKHWRFYSRNSAGKYPLDVSELRAAFALSETTAERVRNFRAERLSMIVAGETPVSLAEVPKIVLHIIPFGAFDPAVRFDMVFGDRLLGSLLPMRADEGFNPRHNFDGFLTYAWSSQSTPAYSYVQVFRSGSVEAVEASILRLYEDERTIPSGYFEKELLQALRRYLFAQKQLGVEPPLFVMLSLLGVSGYTMGVKSTSFAWGHAHPIDRDALLVPEIVVESFDCDPAEAMRPIFDAVWNAAGWPRSMNYDETGKWSWVGP
jgi:hypothetical protein